jgi:hypothetical protein
MTTHLGQVPDSTTSDQLGGIRRWNVIAGFAHLA